MILATDLRLRNSELDRLRGEIMRLACLDRDQSDLIHRHQHLQREYNMLVQEWEEIGDDD